MSFVPRERMSVMVAPEVAALTGEVAFVCHCRDIAVLYPAAFALVTGVRP